MSKLETYITLWPNGTFSINRTTLEDLFDAVDEEGDPFSTKTYKIPGKRFSIKIEEVKGKSVIGIDVGDDSFLPEELELISFGRLEDHYKIGAR